MILSEKWKQIPHPVKLFLLRALVLFIAWKAIYLAILLPNRILDRPLTYAVTIGAVGTLNGAGRSHDYAAISATHPKKDADGRITGSEDTMDIYSHQVRALSIADACNGLELMVLYAGLILCLPARPGRKVLFIGTGILLIEVLNVLRCAGLVLLFQHRPEYVDFSHHYLFSLLVYGAIFWLWWLFSRDPQFAQKLKLNATIAG
jgi:exosortase/archaeosortase family protein